MFLPEKRKKIAEVRCIRTVTTRMSAMEENIKVASGVVVKNFCNKLIKPCRRN